MESLKPCPVCGNDNIDGWTYGEGSAPFVPENVKDLTWGCEDDTCPYSLDNPITVEAWNKRATDRLVEDNVELREGAEKSNAWCVDIFNDFSEDEVSSMPLSIIGAWNRGKQLLNK